MANHDSTAAQQGEMPGGAAGIFQNREANHFVLRGENKQIDFSTSSFAGGPILSYTDEANPSGSRSFSGEQIDIVERPFVKLVTVMIYIIPDAQALYLTLLLPKVNLPQHASEVRVETTAVVSTHRVTLMGPHGVDGQVDTYETLTLKGTADFVLS